MTTTSSDSKLPKELVNTIISHLRFDRKTLEACALTCKAWLEPSRSVLHESIVISSTPESLKHQSQIYSSPALAQCVRNVTFTFSGWPQTDAKILKENKSLLNQLLSSFTHLDCLHLTNLTWDALPSETVDTILGFSKLNALYLTAVTFHSNVQFESTILAFPELPKLVIEDVRWKEILAFPPFEAADNMSLNLRSLRLGKCTKQYDVAERLACYRYPLEKFSVEWEDWKRTEPIRHILRAAGPHLHEFELDIPDLTKAQSVDEFLNLEENVSPSHNPNLRTLHLHSLYLESDPTDNFHITWVYGPLSQANPDSLKRVIFDVWGSSVQSLGRFQWDAIDRLLSADKYKCNPVIEVKAYLMVDFDSDQGKTTEESVRAFIKRHTPRLGNRVVVHPDILG